MDTVPLQFFVFFLLLNISLIFAVQTATGSEPHPGASDSHGYRGRGAERLCDDVAIIGAGISGSYSAWRLRHRNLKISLYEYSDRIGGRLYTTHFPGTPDINLELGGMRFIPEAHPKANNVIKALGLQIVDFPLGASTRDDTLHYLRNRRVRNIDLPTHAPYDLPMHHRINFKKLNSDVYFNYTLDSIYRQNTSDPYNFQLVESLDGVPLYKQSKNAFNHKFLDHETINYLRDASAFSFDYVVESQAALMLPTGRFDPTAPPSIVKTVATGFQSIPVTMVNQFLASSSSHALHGNHHLRVIGGPKHGVYSLLFSRTVSTRGVTSDMGQSLLRRCAKKVILAIPKVALERLQWAGLQAPEISHLLKNAVNDVKAGKIFFGFQSDWYKKHVHYSDYTISDTPLEQTYDFGKSPINGKAVLNIAYSDHSNEVWKEMVSSSPATFPGTDDDSLRMSNLAVDVARKYYAQILDIPEQYVPQPDYAVMRIWDDYPFGSSWYAWAPGFRQDLVARRMLKPSDSDPIFIASNTFSPGVDSGWIEGAFNTVDEMIYYYF
ncbi:aplysianin-A-like [Mya arenaria]|uniref:aplysianin-A-like n=1 Tax=Mya arenaria TaxID=6604 RepID=UPI0022E89B1B|nr:aplysianin-A-like [Mya arenaria]